MQTHPPAPRLLVVLTATLGMAGCAGVASAAQTGGFAVDTQSRETVRNFHNAVYNASNGLDMGWTGKVAGCVAGTVANQYRRASLIRVNYFRAMAGIPAAVTFLDEYNRQAQAAALMMLANQQLSHAPPTDWLCHTPEGAAGAGNSNLAVGMAGPDSISAFMDDEGSTLLGHRRWILYPQTRNMGLGSLEDDTQPRFRQASALWVLDDHFSDPRPATRDDFVAWPPKGYVPYPLLFRNWSIAYPGADFSQASVRLGENGTEIPVAKFQPGNGAGDNALGWSPITALLPSVQDKTYHVTVSNLLVGGVSRNYEYDVTGFDPDVQGADSVFPAITGNARPPLQQASTYIFNKVPKADGYQRLLARLKPFAGLEGAENGAGAFMSNVDPAQYDVVADDVAATGAASFHLAHTGPQLQSLTWNYRFLAGEDAGLRFDSRLGWASPNQSARVEVSVDDGKSWQVVYLQSGSGASGESGFTGREVSLKEYAGKTIRLRFAYAVNGVYFAQSGTGVGWYIDNIRLTHVSRLAAASVVALGKTSKFSFTPDTGGAYLLQVRATAFGGYPLEWGPGFVAKVAP